MLFTHFAAHFDQGLLHFRKFGKLSHFMDSIPLGEALYLDYDHIERNSDWLVNRRAFICWSLHLCGVGWKCIAFRKTRRGYHCVVRLCRNHTNLEIIALQAILESDPMREALNYMRATSTVEVSDFWKSRSNILYDYKV